MPKLTERIAEAVAAERERCAKIVELAYGSRWDETRNTPDEIVRKIRSGDPPYSG